MKTYSLDHVQDELIGKVGTPERDLFEYELQLELTGQEMPYPYQENHNTTGIEWAEEGDDLKNMFPKLYAKYHNII